MPGEQPPAAGSRVAGSRVSDDGHGGGVTVVLGDWFLGDWVAGRDHACPSCGNCDGAKRTGGGGGGAGGVGA